MNRGQVLGPTGAIDYELAAPLPRGVAHATIVVREYNAHFGRHRVVYEGCMRFDEVRRLGWASTAATPHGALDPDLPASMAGG